MLGGNESSQAIVFQGESARSDMHALYSWWDKCSCVRSDESARLLPSRAMIFSRHAAGTAAAAGSHQGLRISVQNRAL